ncbi:penicillin-binding protein 1A [Rhodovibrionaceae bacterium A322]
MRFILIAFSLCILGGLIGAAGLGYLAWSYGQTLPDYKQLAGYEPPTVTRVHAGDGRLLAEYATQKRVFVPIEAMPPRVINAFLSAEDKSFYEHPGIDFKGLARAIVTNLANIGSGRRLVGASTITQQVAKNFLLTNEVSYERKIKEAILAFRLEQAFSKDRLLELYLNEIYLGYGSYGVAAAALNYFNRSLDELSIEEVAYLAALPKAPNNYHPVRKHEAAVIRRNWVIGRMEEDGKISTADATQARSQPLVIRSRDATEVASADHFAEEVRRWLVQEYGEDKLYEGGLSVRTTLDPAMQLAADKALRRGLVAYDRRHGYRGPLANLGMEGDWQAQLKEQKLPEAAAAMDWQLGLVLAVRKKTAEIGLPDGSRGEIPFAELRWARETLKKQKVGPRPKTAAQVLSEGDLILVQPVSETAPDKNGETKPYPEGSYGLRQIPNVDGGLVALDPHTGRVLAMSGGFSYADSQFNRTTQALRQPGSSFKPFVYLSALEEGFTPSTLVLDAPFVIDQGEGLGKWKPANYTKKFYGPTPMRIGLEKSRNLMTIRLAQTVGLDKVVDTADRFKVIRRGQVPSLSFTLGAGEVTLMQMTTAYAMFVNGGKEITPSLVDRVQDRHGRTIFRHDGRDCVGCQVESYGGGGPRALPDLRKEVTNPANAYQIVSMLEGVVLRGTGRKIAAVGKPLAGKTGTTNDYRDAWFVGFSPDLAVGVYVGFDTPRTMARPESGSAVAAPIWRDFMADALKDAPATPFRIPKDIHLVRVVHATGKPARQGDRGIIWEAFEPDNEPSAEPQLLDGGYDPTSGQPAAPSTGSGIY